MHSCRICFVTDVRMVMLGDTKVKEFLESIFNSHGFSEKLNERHYVCFECKAHLNKSYNFIQKALRAQTAFENLQPQKTTDENTWKTLRDTLQLNSSLSFCTVGIDLSIKYEEDELKIAEEIDTKSNLIPLLSSNSESIGDMGNINADNKFPLCNTYIYPNNNEEPEGSKEDKTDPVKHEFYVEIDYIKTEKFEDENCYENTKMSKKPVKAKSTSSKKPALKREIKKKTKIKGKAEHGPVDMSVKKTITRKPRTKNSTYRKKSNLKKKVKKKQEYASDYDSEFEYESYDDESGKRIRRPKEEPRVYPRKCEHCNFIIEAGKFHYYHYVNMHPKEEYPYMRKDRRYVCQFCGIGKKYMSELQEHEMIHAGEKPFVCTTCGKSFCNKKQLRAHHARVHIAPRLFCEYCNKGFKEKSVLKLHIRTHTGEKPYKCPICGAGFAHGGNVGVHMRNVHQQDGSKGKSRSREPKLLQRQEEPINLLTSLAYKPIEPAQLAKLP